MLFSTSLLLKYSELNNIDVLKYSLLVFFIKNPKPIANMIKGIIKNLYLIVTRLNHKITLIAKIPTCLKVIQNS